MVTGSRPEGRRATAYGELAEAYDLVHRHKPYVEEARTIRRLARKYARRPLRTLLDVACGSGRHLEAFARWYSVAGLDASREMLARARQRCPQADLTLGRMETFRLGRRFDVVTCLFSAVGYAASASELRRTLRNLARHTEPGGVVFVEPWITPDRYRTGHVHALAAEAPALKVLRMNDSVRRGGRSIFTFHYLVGRQGRVRHVVERHDLGLFDRRTMLSAFRAAGLRPSYRARGLSAGRGLYVAVRPAASARRAGRRPTAGRSRRPAGS